MLPLVINTSGWVKGIGYDMLVKMLRYMSPSHVVQIRISAESKNLPTGTFWLNGNQKHSVNLFEICAAPKESLNRQVLIKKDAHMIRDLRLIAYFRQCLPRDLDISTYQELVHSLALIPPCEVPLPRIKVQHLHCQPSSSGLYHGLDATVVGLAISSWMTASSEHCTPWCVGLGLVRAVDISKDKLYLISPVPHSTLEKVDLLLQGSIEIPVCLLQGCGSSSPFMSRNVLRNLGQPELDEHIARAEKQFSKLWFH
ncbi:putative Polynucleotide 5'-hydroxyl-kinase NOL9 [Cocos nucifera]|uniref:Putative Polynucleotide 5'-hydroxyl-kinase NOL9 n=1 Tax=Cocos nucifera TaxID=13894 RepID=A0A8K0N2P5_COCNU|nr:putative Polynucleotide 5'-hydroxyl-kinase NOL9 [Cocos nucifera]